MNNYLPKNLDLSGDLPNINGVSLLQLAEEHGTPLYVYDWEHIKDNIRAFQRAFGKETLYRYAAKAFICRAFVEELSKHGWGVDVVSGGEMFTVNETLGTLEDVLFNGTFKSKDEIDYFISNKGGCISIDNRSEVEIIDSIAKKNNSIQKVLVRLNLDLGAETHPMVLTSGHNQQFGISLSSADEVVSSIINSEFLSFSGVHVHIGSQIRDPKMYKIAMEECGSFLESYTENIEEEPVFNAGGGFFSPYAEDDYDEELVVYSESIKQGIDKSWGKGFKLMIEPGRAVVNNPGTILYSTGAIKSDRGEKPYILVDGGMSDNPRPAIYGSEHKLFNISNLSEEKRTFAVSGRHCESGDLLVQSAELPTETKEGDILMSTSTGAYTYSMASNYNRVPKSAVIAISQNKSSIIIENQSFGDTALNDV